MIVEPLSISKVTCCRNSSLDMHLIIHCKCMLCTAAQRVSWISDHDRPYNLFISAPFSDCTPAATFILNARSSRPEYWQAIQRLRCCPTLRRVIFPCTRNQQMSLRDTGASLHVVSSHLIADSRQLPPLGRYAQKSAETKTVLPTGKKHVRYSGSYLSTGGQPLVPLAAETHLPYAAPQPPQRRSLSWAPTWHAIVF